VTLTTLAWLATSAKVRDALAGHVSAISAMAAVAVAVSRYQEEEAVAVREATFRAASCIKDSHPGLDVRSA